MWCDFVGYGTNWFWGVGIMIFRLLALALLFFLGLRIIKRNQSKDISQNPIDILKEKYAKGEIDEEEYNYKIKKLKE